MFKDFSLSSLDMSNNNILGLEAQIFVVRHSVIFIVSYNSMERVNLIGNFILKYNNAVEKSTD